MRIVIRSNTPRRLDLRLRTATVWAYWLFGLLFIVAGIWAAYALGRALEFRCDRVMCRLAVWRGIGWRAKELPAEGLTGARVDTRTSGIVAGMHLVAITRAGDLPIELVGANGDAKDSLAARINRFVAERPLAPLVVAEDARPLGLLLGLVVFAGGVVCLLGIERVRLVMDRDAGMVRLVRARWVGRDRSEVMLERVTGVEVYEVDVGRANSFAVALELKGHAELPLTSLPLFTQASAEQARNLIRTWLETRT